MNERDYNATEGIRRSDLWRMEDSPEKFKYFLEHPAEQTSSMVFGSACHKMILEPNDFGSEYAVAPNIDRRTKEGKAMWEAFCTDNAGKTIISADDAETMREMEEALEKCPLANELLRGEGQTEVPIFWTDSETGEACKCKNDRIVKIDGRYVIVDYKTTVSAETNKFNSEIWRLGYYFQAGMYSEGLMVSLKLDYRPGFMFVAQEKKQPYAVNVIEVSDEVMNAGVAKYRELLQKYHDCKEVDIWPGYMIGDVPNDSFVPTWMEREMEEEE